MSDCEVSQMEEIMSEPITLEITCVNCESYNICKIREYFCSVNGSDKMKIITNDPDYYASLFGGMTAVIAEDNSFEIIKLPVPDTNVLLIHPDIVIKTKDAREIIKPDIILKDHVRQSMLLTRFISSLYTGNQVKIEDIIIEPQGYGAPGGSQEGDNTAGAGDIRHSHKQAFAEPGLLVPFTVKGVDGQEQGVNGCGNRGVSHDMSQC